MAWHGTTWRHHYHSILSLFKYLISLPIHTTTSECEELCCAHGRIKLLLEMIILFCLMKINHFEAIGVIGIINFPFIQHQSSIFSRSRLSGHSIGELMRKSGWHFGMNKLFLKCFESIRVDRWLRVRAVTIAPAFLFPLQPILSGLMNFSSERRILNKLLSSAKH